MLLIIREVQVKTTVRYHLTPVRMSFIPKAKASVGKDVEKREPSCTAGGNADWCSNYGNSMEVPQKIKNGSVLWPSNSTSGNISEETQNTNLKEYMHLYVHCSVSCNK